MPCSKLLIIDGLLKARRLGGIPRDFSVLWEKLFFCSLDVFVESVFGCPFG